MIHIEVKTIYQGKVAIRDKYVEEAIREGCGITVLQGKNKMVIHSDQVNMYAYKSNIPFFDKLTGGAHFLFYYTWKPEAIKPKFKYVQVCPECMQVAWEWKKAPRVGMNINPSKIITRGRGMECQCCQYPNILRGEMREVELSTV